MGEPTVICRPAIAWARALRAPWRNPATVDGTRRRSPRCLLAGGRSRLAWIAVAVAVAGAGAGGAGTWTARRPPGTMGNGDVVTLTGSRGTAGTVLTAAHLRVGPAVVPTAVTGQPYVNPLRDLADLTPERIDQGVDYSGEGPLLAVGPGTVEMTTNAGWPGGAFIALRLESGPDAGRVVYYAEDITPAVAPGQHVHGGQVVGQMSQGPDGIELGWGDPRHVGQSIVADCYQEGGLTGAGLAFSRFLSSLGAPGGRREGRTPTCPMPGSARRAAPTRSGRAENTAGYRSV